MCSHRGKYGVFESCKPDGITHQQAALGLDSGFNSQDVSRTSGTATVHQKYLACFCRNYRKLVNHVAAYDLNMHSGLREAGNIANMWSIISSNPKPRRYCGSEMDIRPWHRPLILWFVAVCESSWVCELLCCPRSRRRTLGRAGLLGSWQQMPKHRASLCFSGTKPIFSPLFYRLSTCFATPAE